MNALDGAEKRAARYDSQPSREVAAVCAALREYQSGIDALCVEWSRPEWAGLRQTSVYRLRELQRRADRILEGGE